MAEVSSVSFGPLWTKREAHHHYWGGVKRLKDVALSNFACKLDIEPFRRADYRRVIDSSENEYDNVRTTCGSRWFTYKLESRKFVFQISNNFVIESLKCKIFFAIDLLTSELLVWKVINVSHKMLLDQEQEMLNEINPCDEENGIQMRGYFIWKNCLLTPLYSGGDFFELIKRRAIPSPLKVIKEILPLFEVMVRCQMEGRLHNDIKSENVFVGEDGTLVLADWEQAGPLRNTIFELTNSEIIKFLCTIQELKDYYPQRDVTERRRLINELADDGDRDQRVVDCFNHALRSEMFSLGAVFFASLYKYPPFDSSDPGNWYVNLDSRTQILTYLGRSQLKKLLSSLLSPMNSKRPLPEEALIQLLEVKTILESEV